MTRRSDTAAGSAGRPADGGQRPAVVVGVDGSDHSKKALRWAAFLSRVTGCPLEVVTVWQVPPVVAGAGWTTVALEWDPEEDARQLLTQTLDEVFGERWPAGMRTRVREGGAAKVLLEAGRTARMLVLGSRGHGGFVGLLMGSVSAACAEHAACPVLVVHGDMAPPDDPVPPDVTALGADGPTAESSEAPDPGTTATPADAAAAV